MAGSSSAANGDDQQHAAAAEESKRARKRRLSDSDDNRDEDEGNGKDFYECRFCHSFFQKSQALGGHMNKHRQEREHETLQKAQDLINVYHHVSVSAQGYTNNMNNNMSRSGQLSATEIAQRSGLQPRRAQFYNMPATAAYLHSTATEFVQANTSFLAAQQHFNSTMPTNSSNNHNHVQQNRDNTMNSNHSNHGYTMNSNHGSRVASTFVHEPTQNRDNTMNSNHDSRVTSTNEPTATANLYHLQQLQHHNMFTDEFIQFLRDSSPSTPSVQFLRDSSPSTPSVYESNPSHP